MIANDARTIVYESMKKNRMTIPVHLEKRINDEIVAATEQMKFKATIPLFEIDKPSKTLELRNKIVAYYLSLGYTRVTIVPHDDMYKLMIEW